MFGWFGQHAPIRLKFKVLLAVYTLLSGCIAAAAIYSALVPSADATLVIAIALAGVAAIAGVTMLASRLICTPYVNTVVRMEALAAGDLTSEIGHTTNRDCVGRMTKAMESFRASSYAAAECNSQRAMALAMGEGLGRLAAGDLTYRIEAALSGPFEQLKEDFNAAVVALQQAMGSVAHAADGIHKGSGEIRVASDDLSGRTEQQAASLEQTAAALDELTQTVRKTAHDAGRANDVVGETRGDAEQSGQIVQRAVGAMADIERSSNEISEIISVIDGIAFQTNLLALNAGVEAARAGDAGKGFAVVAAEVRALAQRSADAAKDVKTRISKSSEQVGVGVDLVNQTGHSLQRIIGRVGEVSQLVSGIASAASHQATGLQEINTAVSEMDSVTQQNAAMVEQATAAAQSLSNEADRLAEQISRFQVGEAGVPASNVAPFPSARPAVRSAGISQKVRPASVRSGGRATATAVASDWAEF